MLWLPAIESVGEVRILAANKRAVSRQEPLPDAEAHSEGFRQMREARRGALVEDYVELIVMGLVLLLALGLDRIMLLGTRKGE